MVTDAMRFSFHRQTERGKKRAGKKEKEKENGCVMNYRM
jgi:hypothetical protein